MIVIYAEKADVGNKIAAALGGFDLPGGTRITYKNLKANEKNVKSFQNKQGFLEITFDGKPCKVTWGYGHMFGLYDVYEYEPLYKSWKARPEAFIPKEFKLHAISSELAAFKAKLDQQRRIISKLFSSAEYIINATDFDREGELIFAYIYEAMHCTKPFKRAHFTSQTESGIREAFDHLKPASEIHDIEMAGRARSIYDWLIGTNLTTRITLKHSGNDVLSVGRVQTPVLKMLVDRELAIRSFKSSAFWTIEGTFTTDSGELYKGKHRTKRFDDKKSALDIMKDITGKPGVVSDVSVEKAVRKAPLLYSLSALQMDANDKYGFTAEQVLNIAQWLYENGYTTYPRTKSQYLNDDMIPTVISVLDAVEHLPEYTPYLTGVKKTPDKRYFDSTKVDSHFAIIPTIETPKSLSTDQKKIYDMIAKSVIRMIYPDAVLENTTVVTTVDKHEFLSKGTVIVQSGWLSVDAKIKEELLPTLSKGENVSGKYECKEGKTEPPKRYTDKTLITAMKTAGRDLADEELKKILADPKVEGIGTEATRADIINTLIKRRYAERKGKQFYATDKGVEFISVFPIHELMSPEFTAKMEKELSDIASGSGDYNSFIEQIKRQTVQWCHEIVTDTGKTMSGTCAAGMVEISSSVAEKTDVKCPVCGSELIEYKWGWSCSNHSGGCVFSVSHEICKKKISTTMLKKLIKDGKTNLIKGFTGKSGKKFDAVLCLSEGKIKFDFETTTASTLNCPVCGKPLTKYKWGWGCSGYKDGCHFSVGNMICQKPITEAILDRIVKTGSSGVIHDFVAKSGKKFDAELKINADKVVMSFVND